MPEGHVIERIAREHNRTFRGQRVDVSSPQGRFADGAAQLNAHVFLGARALGKHSFHRFAADGDRRTRHDLYLHVHLGLYGKWSGGSGSAPDPVGAVRVRLRTPSDWADLRGATACEVLTHADVQGIVDRLGEDPLHSKENGIRVFTRLQRSTRPIGLALMDQSVIAGVGNVYRAELLFRHGLSPYAPSDTIDPLRWQSMWTDLVRLMRAGVRAGRIVTTERADRARRTGPATAEDQYYVYRRAGLPCRRCGTPICTAELAARNLYWCPTCQSGEW